MLIIILETVNLCRSGYLNGRELGMTMIQQSKPRVSSNLSELEAGPAFLRGNGSRGSGQPSKGVNGIKVRLGLRKEVI